MTAAILAGHRKVAPYGARGGQPGELGASWIERAKDGAREPLEACDQRQLEPGDVFVVSTPSGGGYGSLT
jgi:5-oxoprolinase (ATP-hydrolysing)